MSRAARTHRLSLLIAIALLYIEGYETLKREAYPRTAAFPRMVIFKYFLVAIRILAGLRQSRDSYLGALGTHVVKFLCACLVFFGGWG
jgi:hypothetical protein